MQLLKSKLKTKDQVKIFIDKLIIEVKKGDKYNSLDGFIIGLIYANSKYISYLLLNDHSLPYMTDNVIGQLEQCCIWLTNNEEELIKL